MYHMLSCFNLKPDVSVEAFTLSLKSFFDHMHSIEMVHSIGPLCKRDSDTPMDTDSERNHQYYFVTHFVDKAQCDHSYRYIAENHGLKNTQHAAVYQKVVDPVFICYDEIGE